MIKHSRAQQKSKPPLSYEEILGIREVMGYTSPKRDLPVGTVGLLSEDIYGRDLSVGDFDLVSTKLGGFTGSQVSSAKKAFDSSFVLICPKGTTFVRVKETDTTTEWQPETPFTDKVMQVMFNNMLDFEEFSPLIKIVPAITNEEHKKEMKKIDDVLKKARVGEVLSIVNKANSKSVKKKPAKKAPLAKKAIRKTAKK